MPTASSRQLCLAAIWRERVEKWTQLTRMCRDLMLLFFFVCVIFSPIEQKSPLRKHKDRKKKQAYYSCFVVISRLRTKGWDGILLPKLFWPTVKKNCSSDREKFLKFKAEGQEFAKILRSIEQFVQTVKGQNNFW